MNLEKAARHASRADSVGIIIQVHLEIAEEPSRWQALPGKGAGSWDDSAKVGPCRVGGSQVDFSEAVPAPGEPCSVQ